MTNQTALTNTLLTLIEADWTYCDNVSLAVDFLDSLSKVDVQAILGALEIARDIVHGYITETLIRTNATAIHQQESRE